MFTYAKVTWGEKAWPRNRFDEGLYVALDNHRRDFYNQLKVYARRFA